MIEVDRVTRTYPSPDGGVHALDGVTFSVPAGGLVALVGRSGSGKTTLLNCIGGLDRVTEGVIRVGDAEVTALDERGRAALRRDGVAFVFQTFGLLPTLTAAENVGLPLRLRRAEPRERERRVAELLERVGLGAHAGQRPGELSGGQQQRVAIARALANRPPVLIADEPTGQLDSETGAEILALLRDTVHDEGMTALIATHDPAFHAIADATLHLADGRIDGAAAA